MHLGPRDDVIRWERGNICMRSAPVLVEDCNWDDSARSAGTDSRVARAQPMCNPPRARATLGSPRLPIGRCGQRREAKETTRCVAVFLQAAVQPIVLPDKMTLHSRRALTCLV